MSKQLSKRIEIRLNKLLNNELDMALKRRAVRIIEELNPQTGEKILEAGCGPGYYLRILNCLGLEMKLYGVDIDEAALTKAREILNKKSIYRADLTKKLPFKENYFDKIILSEVLEHIPNDEKALRMVYSVLRPGGKLIITVPNKDYPFSWDPVNWMMERLFKKHVKKGFWAGIWSNHIRLYSVSRIKKLVEKAKFSVTDYETLTWWSLPFSHNFLYGGKLKLLPKDLSNKVLKQMGSESTLKKTVLQIFNASDRLNDIYKSRRVGVGILVVAQK